MKVLVDRDKKLSDSFTHSLTHSPYNISNIYIFIVIYSCNMDMNICKSPFVVHTLI